MAKDIRPEANLPPKGPKSISQLYTYHGKLETATISHLPRDREGTRHRHRGIHATTPPAARGALAVSTGWLMTGFGRVLVQRSWVGCHRRPCGTRDRVVLPYYGLFPKKQNSKEPVSAFSVLTFSCIWKWFSANALLTQLA